MPSSSAFCSSGFARLQFVFDGQDRAKDIVTVPATRRLVVMVQCTARPASGALSR
jgi:hypothetical protein